MLIIAYLVRRSSAGGALFFKTRVGRTEKPFQ
jgi:lipopolysaccharide/colanic/teichoic acid biosynthesis glycosyltransferase